MFAAWLWLASPIVGLAPGGEVSWEAPAGCPSAREFSARVDALRGPATLTASFEFSVVSNAGRLELRVGERGERFVAARCDALVDTALLLVSLALAPAERDTEPGRDRTPRRPSAADRDDEARDVAPFLRAPERRRDRFVAPTPTRARLMVEAGLTALVTPTPAADVALAAGPRGRAWSVDLGLLARPSFAGGQPVDDVGARLSTWAGLVRACGTGRLRRVAISGCAAVELGVISARATGSVNQARIGRQPWLSVELGPELSVPLGRRVALTARVSAVGLPVQPAFRVTGAGSVCCAQPLGVSSRLGVEIGLGS